MWANILKYLGIEILRVLAKKIKEYFAKQKKDEENEKKVDNYVEADGQDAARDAFNKLP